MQNKKKLYSMNKLYIIFFSTVLFINFFFINSLKANVFKITDIEITEPFELNFNREKVSGLKGDISINSFLEPFLYQYRIYENLNDLLLYDVSLIHLTRIEIPEVQ